MSHIKGKFIISKGCLFINVNYDDIQIHLDKYKEKIPVIAQKNRLDRDGKNYHITIINSEEMKNIDTDDIIPQIINTELYFYIFGLGINSGCYYLVCGCKEADMLRQKKKLRTLHYHITLGFDFEDKHDINKNMNTIVLSDGEIIENTLKSLSTNSKKTWKC